MSSDKEAIAVYLDPELKQRFREHAARQRRSMSALVETLVRAEMDLVAGLEALPSVHEEELLKTITGEHDALPDDLEGL